MSAYLTDDISRACDALNCGDLVAMPTETVYGLAADVFNEAAIKKIFSYKDRPSFNPLIVHIGKTEDIHRVVKHWPMAADVLAKKFWPGPLTIITQKADNISDLITAGLKSVGLRMPNHKVALELLNSYKTPLAAPSANRSNHTSPTEPEHVLSEFPGRELLVLNGGKCQVGIESTVLEVFEDKVVIYRMGAITKEQIAEVLGNKVGVVIKESMASPGQQKEHYKPDLPLIIVNEKVDVSTPEFLFKINKHMQVKEFTELILNKDPLIAARELYGQLREKSQLKVDAIVTKKNLNQSGSYWDAIWDRLCRASSLDLTI